MKVEVIRLIGTFYNEVHSTVAIFYLVLRVIISVIIVSVSIQFRREIC